MLAQLGALLPGLPEGVMRRRLFALRQFLETQNVLQFTQTRHPTYSSEIPAASGR
jgi:hypothetical protein